MSGEVDAASKVAAGLLAAHPDAQAILDKRAAGQLRFRLIADETEMVMTLGVVDSDGSKRPLASLDMKTGERAYFPWRLQ